MLRWIVLALVVTAWCASLQEPRIWWSGPQVSLLGSPSPDGRRISFADPSSGALGIRDLSAGSWRPIAARPPGTREFTYFSVFSPDGRSVAYA